MGDSYAESSTVGRDLLRSVFAFLDRPAYWLLGVVYQLFFNVASADIFSNNTIMKFYGRVQVILGVFMMFQLAMTILRGIIDPDSFSKDKGGGNLLKRVATSLLLLTLMMPIGIGSPRNEYEKQINNNGLLFGTLYSLQHRILSNNTLGRLVLGTTGDTTTYIDADDEDELETSSRVFTSTVLKGFYRINLVPENERVDSGDKDPATINENRMCKDIDDDVLAAYTRLDADPGEIIGMVNETCTVDWNPLNHIWGLKSIAGTRKYVFNYMPFISMIVAIVFVFILLSFTIDVAVRAVKLAVLRLLAPIPLIAYMDPKGSGDEAFKSWTKTLTSTYLDLFIRLAVVYFVIFIIQDMIVNGIVIEHGSGVIGVLSLIIIWIGLFVFAKNAPKFIKQVLGLKDSNFNLFGGIAELGAAASLGAGTFGSFNASRQASRLSDEARGKNPNSFPNMAKHFAAGIFGAGSGFVTGAKAWGGAKDQQGKAVMDAMQKRNATVISKGASGATIPGQLSAMGHRLFQGEGATTFDGQTREIAQKKNIDKSAKDLFSYLEGKGKTDGAMQQVTTASISQLGNSQIVTSVNELNKMKAQAQADLQRGVGDGTVTLRDSSGNTHKVDITSAAFQKVEEETAYAAGDWWAMEEEKKGAKMDNGYRQKRDTYNESINGASDPSHHGLYTRYERDSATGKGTFYASKLKKTSKAAGGEAARIENSDAYKRKQANYGASKKS